MVFPTTRKVKKMPLIEENILQQILFFEEYIELETEKEQLTALPSVLLPRLQDGLSRSQEQLRKLQEK